MNSTSTLPAAETADLAPSPCRWWWWPRGTGLCVASALGLTLLLAAPVLQAPRQRLFGHEIVGRAHDPFTVGRWFEHPTRPTVATQPATDYPGALLAQATGGVAAYNAIVLLSFPLAALFAYALAFHLTASVAASWIVALAFSFSPFHLAHAAYHPHIAQVQWLPLYLLALWRALERAAAGRLVTLLGAWALVALSNFYFGLIAGVLTPLAVAGFWYATGDGSAGRSRAALVRVVGTLAGAAALGGLYVLWVAPGVWRDSAAFAFPPVDLERYTAHWFSYLVPPAEHPLFGAWARAFWASKGVRIGLVEQQLTVGFGLSLLALMALGAWWRGRQSGGVRAVPALSLLAVAAFLCSLAPVWRVGGLSVPRPAAALYALAPMFRAHARFGVVVFLAVALLAGVGWVALRSAGSRRAHALAFSCLLIAGVELLPLPPWRWRDVLPTAAHRWLVEEQGGGARVLDCIAAADPAQLSVPALFGPGVELLGPHQDCGEAALAGKLAARGIRYLIVRRPSRSAGFFEQRPPAAGFRLRRSFDDALLFEVVAPPDLVSLELGSGFYEREQHGDRSWRWFGERAALELSNRTGQTLRVTLVMTLHAFAVPRRLVVSSADGRIRHELLVATEPARHIVGSFDLPPGAQALRLSSAAPATVADDLLHNGDLRAVSVALWDWQLGVEPISAGAAPD